ncbi:tryptophan--tRNA ligase [Helicobacter bilis]|uniref:tryptophan--tRNA ligase n=1 Tax=Helicobacter bilis TaxID=37372 RepID=UPI0026ED815B|nr:tryptophan--tRNA ligase [Helicobacter bilis]MCI7411406.1 tryptophan--tRNA ligase [Helicobacter bilis]MDD7296397.1 tryptophan--tRNA ligase [Helicobacter bilis]MDY4400427.1 tryptophan--tRNA ligase [Helicobacter bilis]
MKKRAFSGIQPTGSLHLGNYLGAIKQWVKNQAEYENIYCVVNTHAITIHQDPKVLQQNTIELFAMLLACGLTSENTKLFVQSRIDYHGALAWILDCNIGMGEMSRMTQFKDKSQKNPQNINVGLFNYPALMAADILLYQSDFVPVGEDQKQHLELTRNVAMRFNERYGECFKVPEPLIAEVGARIMSLDDPSTKMSKSNKGEYSAINLLDSKDSIIKKVKKATTDSFNEIVFDKERAGLYNLLCIYECITGKSRNEIENSFKGYGEFKIALAEVIFAELEPIQQKYHQFMKEKTYINDIITRDETYIRDLAQSTYDRAKSLVGLI